MQKSNTRRGSIPLVLLVIVVLGIGAASSLFLTQGTGRLDKHSELNQNAWFYAQSAIEEVLVKITNNAADFAPDKRQAFEPHAARFMGQQVGVTVGNVEVMGRVIDAPQDPAQNQKFEEILTAVPGFAGSNHDDDWRNAVRTGPFANTNLGALEDPTGEGQEYGESGHQKYDNANDPVRQAFDQVYTHEGPLRSGAAARQASFASLTEPFATADDITDPTLQAFAQDWDLAMNAVANRVKNRIDGCAGNPNYGVGAEIGALAFGAEVQADGHHEEEVRNSAEKGGALSYRANLVTLTTEAQAEAAGMRSRQAVTVHRLVSRISMKDAMDKIRLATVGYLNHHYGLTLTDMAAMGWITVGDASGQALTIADVASAEQSGNLNGYTITPNADMLTKLNERYPDNPNPFVAPFSAGACLSKVKGT